jgi:4-hydroxybenzoate polyprenyltransferase
VPGDVLAGAAVTGTLGPQAAGLAAVSVCFYWAGMSANDWVDRDLDARERPGRPIPSGRVTPGTALGIAVTLTGAGLGLAGLAGGRRALAVAVALAGTVWWYDCAAKHTAAGPAAMAACRGLDLLLGASPGPGPRAAGRWRAAGPALTVAAHTYTVTALSRREVTGGGPVLPVATLASTAAVAAAAAAPLRTRNSLATWRRLLTGGLVSWYGATYGAAQLYALSEPGASTMRAAVEAGITSLPALQGALIARSGRPAVALAVSAAAPLGRRLARWVSPT